MDSGLLIAPDPRMRAGRARGAEALRLVRGTGRFFEGIGFRPGVPFALAAGMAELGGGILGATGFLWPVGPALCVMVMLLAMLAVPWGNGFSRLRPDAMREAAVHQGRAEAARGQIR